MPENPIPSPAENPEPGHGSAVTTELLPEGKPKGHVNISKTGRWFLRQSLGSKRGQAAIDLIEHMRPEDLEKIAGRVGQFAGLIRGRL